MGVMNAAIGITNRVINRAIGVIDAAIGIINEAIGIMNRVINRAIGIMNAAIGICERSYRYYL